MLVKTAVVIEISMNTAVISFLKKIQGGQKELVKMLVTLEI